MNITNKNTQNGFNLNHKIPQACGETRRKVHAYLIGSVVLRLKLITTQKVTHKELKIATQMK